MSKEMGSDLIFGGLGEDNSYMNPERPAWYCLKREKPDDGHVFETDVVSSKVSCVFCGRFLN